MKQYETIIGLEVHVELATRTKIFCGCSTAFGGAPNTHTCPVCTGMPGSLPVLNKKVVEYAMAVGLATNCSITRDCKFDRKNYFYPDNPQNYQISQLYLPICRDGHVDVKLEDGTEKSLHVRVGMRRRLAVHGLCRGCAGTAGGAQRWQGSEVHPRPAAGELACLCRVCQQT